jgi:hypothetical protein
MPLLHHRLRLARGRAWLSLLIPYLPFTDRIIKGVIKRTYEAANGIVLKEY